jgi:hypothetical protein
MPCTEKTELEVVRDWDEFHRSARKPQACVECGRGDRLGWNGRSCRSASVREGDRTMHVAEVRQRRLRCSACGADWIHRPPGLLPNKHFQPCVIARAVSEYLHGGESLEVVAAAHGLSRRTLARNLPWVAGIADPAVLLAKVIEAADAVVLPAAREIARRFEALRHPVRVATLHRAAQVLALMEALASALQLEPPGLRSVVERFLNGRTDVGTYRRPVIPELARGAQLV